MPYKDPIRQREAMKQWRQANLFEVKEYDRNRQRPPEYHEKRYQQRKERYSQERGPKLFVMCDGEGMGEGYEHRYYVWRMGSKVLVTGRELESLEILEFIVDQPQGPIYCIFSGNYDFTMILRGLPDSVVEDLLNREARVNPKTDSVRPVRWEGFRLDYIPHKRLSVSRGDKTIIIHDVFGFFQTTFVNALEEWEIGTAEVRAEIAAGKDRRGATDVLDARELEYNRIECELGAEMMSKLDSVTQSIMLTASPYEGAGAIASSLFRTHVTKRIKERNRHRSEDDQEPLTFQEIDPAHNKLPTWEAYYGGRFEITAHGPIPGPVYEYDINSAYPAVIANLPCLLHGKWSQRGRIADPGRLSGTGRPVMGYIRWENSATSYFGPLPHRNNQGNVTYPLRGAGWYWAIEWPSDPTTYQVLDSWEFVQACDDKPFDWVPERYEQRRQHKQAGRKGQSMMLKLGINSLYGKMAQGVGKAPWRNSVYAGLVTATCRRWLRDAAEQNPSGIIMFATDGIYSLERLSLSMGDNLGDWEYGVYERGMHIVRPGIYFDGNGDNAGPAKVKSRGIARKVVERYSGEIRRAFDDIHAHPEWFTSPAAPRLMEEWSVPLQFNGLVSLRLAYSQNRPERAGYFGTLPHRMSYNLFPKRVPIDTNNPEGNWRNGILRSGPPPIGPTYRSVGYGPADPDSNDDWAMDMVETAPQYGRLGQVEIPWTLT